MSAADKRAAALAEVVEKGVKLFDDSGVAYTSRAAIHSVVTHEALMLLIVRAERRHNAEGLRHRRAMNAIDNAIHARWKANRNAS